MFNSNDVLIKLCDSPSPGNVNLIIDGFVGRANIEQLKLVKERHPTTTYIFVLTEFYTGKPRLSTINDFTLISGALLQSTTHTIFRVVGTHRQRVSSKQLFFTLLSFLAVPAIFTVKFCLYLVQASGNPLDAIRQVYRDLKFHIYFSLRRSCLSDALDLSDQILDLHHGIGKSLQKAAESDKALGANLAKYRGSVLPQFSQDTMASLLEQKISKPGPAKRKVLVLYSLSNSLNRQLVIKSLISKTCDSQSVNVIDVTDSSRPLEVDIASLQLFLQIPKYQKWSYCSPVRIFRAIEMFRAFPVSLNDSDQEITQILNLNLLKHEIIAGQINDPEFWCKKLDGYEKKIIRYNKNAIHNNKCIVQQLMKLRLNVNDHENQKN